MSFAEASNMGSRRPIDDWVIASRVKTAKELCLGATLLVRFRISYHKLEYAEPLV
jgi:hypothetical protein